MKKISKCLAFIGCAMWTVGAWAAGPGGSLSIASQVKPADIRAYWTAARMQAAKPYVLPLNKKTRPPQSSQLSDPMPGDGVSGSGTGKPPGSISPAAGIIPQDYGQSLLPFTSSLLTPRNLDLYDAAYKPTGKLFFKTWDGFDAWCSASVIDDRVIVTAGHCLMGFNSSGVPQFHNSWLFDPAYRAGAPYGAWTWNYAEVSWSWYYGTPSGRGGVPNQEDIGVIVLNDQTVSGVVRKVSYYTGTFGYQTNDIINSDGTCNNLTIFGYPANMDGGNYAHRVNTGGACIRWYGYNNVEVGSDMGGGSSGGPWLVNFGSASSGQINGLDPARNKVVGVVSWGYTDDGLFYKSQGASVLNGEFLNALDHACASAAGNC